MEEVQNKWDTLKLNDDIWAKLIYFEQNRRLAKAYVSAPVLTIDGSTNGLDGFRIGLSGIDNTYRNLDSVGCLRSIGQGVKLKIDSQGNILIRKISAQRNTTAINSRCSVWIRDWPMTSSQCTTITSATTLASKSTLSSGADIDEKCTMREIEQSDISYKLFDMRRFRHYLERRKSLDTGGAKLDWRQCVSIISFVRKQTGPNQSRPADILADPCWIMIINIIAIDMIKSTICDDGQSEGQKLSSTLAQQHSLLNQPCYPPKEQMDIMNSGKLRPSLRSSSSTSVLYQPSQDSNQSAPLNVDNKNRANKKVRTSNPRASRPSPSIRNEVAQQRRYQSTQQLSNNNIIYTTFNSKFMNTRSSMNHRNCDMTTSDYYSGSRSSSNGRNYDARNGSSIYSPSSIQNQRLLERPSRPVDEARGTFARGDLVRQLEHNRSLSSFDLSLQRFNFKPIQSSAIRMYYDHFSEAEDGYEQENEEISCHHTNITDRAIVCDETTEHTIDHHDSVADGSKVDEEPLIVSERRDRHIQGKKLESHSNQAALDHSEFLSKHNGSITKAGTQNQKISRSSLTSSSSSGCADNDYFMSQSSSSMSSSTGSNDRESSSQPASSSGIACSGNSSDDYGDNNRKPVKEQSSACVLMELSNRLPPSEKHKLNEPEGDMVDHSCTKIKARASSKSMTNLQTNRRGYKIKTIAAHHFQDIVDPHDCDVCDCEPPAGSCDCEHCYCDCTIDEQLLTPLEPLNCCDCDAESIYDSLPAPKSLGATRRKLASKGGGKKSTKNNKDGIELNDNVAAHHPTTKKGNQGERKIVDSDTSDPNGAKSAGWLEKRKYSKIFPKFIFSSSSNSRRTGVSDVKGSTQNKSQTLNREEKFRLTQSTKELS